MPLPAWSIETPSHTVLETFEFEGSRIEFRRVAPHLVAETVVDGADLDAASTEGFKRLAGFIFGGNRSSEKMDMTAPVGASGGKRAGEKMDMTAPVGATRGSATAAGDAEAKPSFTISFVMPSKYTLQTLPVPNDSRVTIRQVPERKVAAVVFSGRWTNSNFDKHTLILLRALQARGIAPASSTQVARYNAPFTPWFLRHNEIQVGIP